MNKLKIGIAIAAVTTILVGCNQQSDGLQRASGVPESEAQKESYSLGQNMGGSLKSAKIEIDSSYFNAGFYDAMDGEQKMTETDMQAVLMALQQKMQQVAIEEQQGVLAERLVKAEEFLASNAELEGVTTTESGLQYKVINEGGGAVPVASDTVIVHYEGRLVDGNIFDSSYERDNPATFPVQGVIAGWTEALQLMSVGSKWQLVIPPGLAYGESGAGNLIGPNSALVFDVELIGIQGQESEPETED